MKNLVNRVQLIGNLGMDPVLTTVANDKNLVRFSLATNEYFLKKNGERATDTTWHNVIAWGPLAEHLAAALQKGMEVAIAGKLRNRSWEDKEGKKHYMTEVVADEFYRIQKNKATERVEAKEPSDTEVALPF